MQDTLSHSWNTMNYDSKTILIKTSFKKCVNSFLFLQISSIIKKKCILYLWVF